MCKLKEESQESSSKKKNTINKKEQCKQNEMLQWALMDYWDNA